MSEDVIWESTSVQVVMYGMYDADDGCWIGGLDGPLLYDDLDLATIGAAVSDMMLGNAAGRTRATPFTGAGEWKDEPECRMSAVKAIERLERGLLS